MRTKMILKFSSDITNSPITYDLVKKFDLKINILKANIDHNLDGILVFDIDGNSKNIAKSLEYLENVGVVAELITNTINIDKELCVDCGICIGSCKIRALSLDNETWALDYNEEKCVGCNMCVHACPTRAISNAVW